jgi:hypothetical protein
MWIERAYLPALHLASLLGKDLPFQMDLRLLELSIYQPAIEDRK